MFLPPRRIVLSGGGIRCVSYVGALKPLHETGALRSIREWVGVSAGALIGFLFVLGYTFDQIEKTAKSLDFGILRLVDPEYALDFFESYGLDPGTNLEKFLQSLIRIRGFPATLTFAQAKEKGLPEFRCYATSLQDGTLTEFSTKKTPSMTLVTALRASMSLPFYFYPVKGPSGETWVDGGLMGNYPMDHLTEREAAQSLGFTFAPNESRSEPIDSFEKFVAQTLMSMGSNEIHKKIQYYAKNTVVIPCAEYPMWNFEASLEDKERLMEIGERAMRDFMETGHRRAPRGIRRYSVS